MDEEGTGNPLRFEVANKDTDKGNEGQADQMQTECPVLIDDVLRIVFNRLDKHSLLACRLVSTHWNLAALRFPEIMAKLTFNVNVHDITAFLQSSLVASVKSIKIQDLKLGAVCRERRESQVEDFFDKIAHTVESVTLKFHNESPDTDTKTKRLIFSLVMSKCRNLKELHILSSVKELIEERQRFPVSSRLKVLSVNMQFPFESRLLKAFIFSHDKITTISFYGFSSYWFGEIDKNVTFICDILMELSSSSLKCITFPDCRIDVFHPDLYKILFTADRLGIATEVIHFPDAVVDLNGFVNAVKEYSQHGFNVHKNRFSSIIAGECSGINLDEAENREIFQLCSNLNYLKLDLLMPTRLGPLRSLQNLRTLYVTCDESYLKYEAERSQPIIDLQFGLNSLQNLRAVDVTFKSTELYFPNLVQLELKNSVELRENTILCLSKLTKLESLTMENFMYLEDSMLTFLSSRFIPAVAAFDNLKRLRLSYCVWLTDRSLVCGIAGSKTLEEVEFRFGSKSNIQFTKWGIDTVLQAGRLKLGEYSETVVRFVSTKGTSVEFKDPFIRGRNARELEEAGG